VDVALAPDRLTVKSAKLPSVTALSDTAIEGTASLSSSAVVTLPALPLIASCSKPPPVADTSDTVKLSAPSNSASSSVAMLTLALLALAGIVSVDISRSSWSQSAYSR